MKDTNTKRPGRPQKYDEPLERVQMMVFRSQKEDAEVEAERRGVTISEVYRDWLEAGRKRSRK